MKISRVFVPLSTKPYNWFVTGNKRWELRKYGRQYTEKNIVKNRLVELRCGYSDPQKALWGIIEDYYIFDEIESVYENINFEEVIPDAKDKRQAIKMSKEILNITSKSNDKFIIFKVLLLENPQFIEISKEFFDIIKSGIKKSTIRRGVRNYNKGICVLYCESESLIVKIDNIKSKILTEITHDEAKTDGFDNIYELQTALRRFYSELDENEVMTIIEFHVDYKGEYKLGNRNHIW